MLLIKRPHHSRDKGENSKTRDEKLTPGFCEGCDRCRHKYDHSGDGKNTGHFIAECFKVFEILARLPQGRPTMLGGSRVFLPPRKGGYGWVIVTTGDETGYTSMSPRKRRKTGHGCQRNQSTSTCKMKSIREEGTVHYCLQHKGCSLATKPT